MIKKIEIHNLGSHKFTEFNLSKGITFIYAHNGTGKSLFASSFQMEDNDFLRGWVEDTSITLKAEKNKKGTIMLNDNTISWVKKGTFNPNILLYNDFNFFQTLKAHYKGKNMISLNDEINNIRLLESNLEIIYEIEKKSEKILKLNSPTKKNREILSKRPIHHYLSEHAGARRSSVDGHVKIAEKICKNYNKQKLNEKIHIDFLKSLNPFERSILRKYFAFLDGKLQINSFIMREYRSFREEVLRNRKINKFFNERDKQKISNLVLWTWYFEQRKFRDLMKMSHRLLFDNVFEKENNILKLLKKDVKTKLKLEEEKFNRKSKKIKNISAELRQWILNTPLGKKIDILDDLTVQKGSTSISLSSGEWKVLNIFQFVKEAATSNNDLVVFDDPFTSADITYTKLLMTLIKNDLRNKQIIFLTHSHIVFDLFKNMHKNNIKYFRDNAPIMYNWSLNDDFNVVSEMNDGKTSYLKNYFDKFENDDSKVVRIFAARKIFEYLCFIWMGHNSYDKIENDKIISIFGKEIRVSENFISLMNTPLHTSVYSIELETLDTFELDIIIEDFKNIFNEIKFNPTRVSVDKSILINPM